MFNNVQSGGVTANKRRRLADKRAILEKIDQGEEEEEQQNGREGGAFGPYRMEIDGVDHGEDEKGQQNGIEGGNIVVPYRMEIDGVEQQNGMERGAIVQCRLEIDEVEQHNKAWICKHLPEELMIENILTRLPARTLAICSCVCKLWFNSIFNDSRFSMIHYTENKNKLFLVFNLLNVLRGSIERTYWFSLLGGGQRPAIRCLSSLNIKEIYELVGFCNGLACMKLVSASNDTFGSITVVNPIRCEALVLPYVPPTGGYIYLCHGFGFDSLAQVYKAVIVFASKANNEIICMVITLGTMSWRKIITSASDISPPPGYFPFPSRMVKIVTRVLRTLCRPATFSGGDLFWRTQNKVRNGNDKFEMLLSFDLHNEKIHFIRLPTECTLTTAPSEPRYLVVDHLLEFKGYPCIARSERITRSNNDHCGHRCDYQTGVCCCCYKVHMYILKDKDKQVWIKEETFDVQIKDQHGSTLCLYFDTSAATPSTRILTFSDQVLLYWFNGVHLIIYNLQEKHLKVVECSRSYSRIFQTKMNEDLNRRIGDDDNIYCPSMDYQLHAQVENIVSLKTFIPKGAKTSKFDSVDKLLHSVNNNLAAGLLSTGRESHTYYAFS